MRARYFLVLFLMALLWAIPVFAAEGAEDHGEEAHGNASNELAWKIANFALLAGGLGYLIYKKGLPYFRSRTESIRKDIEEADRIRRQAEERAAEMDRRMANLQATIDEMRRQAGEEMAAENDRIRRETESALEKVKHNAEQEIAGATKAARHEVKSYGAELALQLAEGKLQSLLNEAADDALVSSFLEDIEKSRAKARKELN